MPRDARKGNWKLRDELGRLSSSFLVLVDEGLETGLWLLGAAATTKGCPHSARKELPLAI